MCGRYVLATQIPEVASFFSASFDPQLAAGFQPSWNVPPTENVPAVAVDRSGERTLSPYRWGLVPSWAKSLSYGANTINARAEQVATKPSFRAAFRMRRCLVPADGYFEWATTSNEPKQPYYFTRSDGAPLAFAGLWEAWPAPLGAGDPPQWIPTCAIVTTTAGADVESVHSRMPVILEAPDWDAWLDPTLHDREVLESLLRPAPGGTLRRRRVDRAVGNVRNNGPQLIDELTTSPSLF